MKKYLPYLLAVALLAVGIAAGKMINKPAAGGCGHDHAAGETCETESAAVDEGPAPGEDARLVAEENTEALKSGKVFKTRSGLKYVDIKVGTGPSPRKGQSVTVHYTGWLTNGIEFDSSLNRGEPYSFVLQSDPPCVIAGWDEGVASMKVGGKRKLFVPSGLAYADRGQGPIPPNADLVFDVELLGVK